MEILENVKIWVLTYFKLGYFSNHRQTVLLGTTRVKKYHIIPFEFSSKGTHFLIICRGFSNFEYKVKLMTGKDDTGEMKDFVFYEVLI